MPLLPLPTGGQSLAGGALPVSSALDVIREFPEEHLEPEVAPVRDAFAEAFAAGAIEYQTDAAQAAAQADPTRATGVYLDLHGDDRDVRRRTGELDTPYRARLFTTPGVVTPEALLAGVNAMLAPLTDKRAELFEPELDGWFVHSSSASVWDSFVGANPTYLDRLYEADAASNGGVFATGNNPGGAIPTFAAKGRCFVLRIPALEGVDTVTLAAVTGSEGGVFLFDGTETTSLTQYIFEDAVTADEIYASIVDFVQRFKAQGIAWAAMVDPSL